MKKLALLFLSLLFLIAVAKKVSALPDNRGTEKAKEKSPAIDQDGEIKAPPEFVAQLPEEKLTRVFFIRFAPGKEPKCNDNGICEKGENWKNCPNDCPKNDEETKTACYDFLAGSKPRWNWIEDYYYGESDLGPISFRATEAWEEPVSKEIFGSGIFGNYQWGVYDYNNALSYGDYDDAGFCPTEEPCVLAVTAIWFRGKNIYEYDILFDTDFFPGDFDLETVVLHEFGHAAGLGDLYDGACIDNVMYGYLGEGEEKTDLREGDIKGIQKLYNY